MLLEYTIVYLLSGLIGWKLENIYNGNQTPKCSDTFNKKYLNLCLPFLHLWGVGGILLLFLSSNIERTNVFISAVIIGIFLTALEGVAGLISYKVNGYQTWNYDKNFVPLLHGYIALDICFAWMIIALIFLVLHPIVKENFCMLISSK